MRGMIMMYRRIPEQRARRRLRVLYANWPLHVPGHATFGRLACAGPGGPPSQQPWKYILCSRVVERMRRALPPIPLAVPRRCRSPAMTRPMARRCPGWLQKKQLKKGAAWIDEFRACNQNPEHSSAWGLPAPPCQNQLMCPPRRDRDASQSAIRPLIGPCLDKLRRWGLAFVAFSIPICPPPVFRPLAKSREVVHN